MSDQDLPKRGVRLDNNKSKFAPQIAQKRAAEEFEKKANEAHATSRGRQELALDLGKKFLEIIKSNTLPENKGPLEKSVEDEVLGKLKDFAIETNQDPTELEGMGSISLLILLLKISLIVRDRQNKFDFRLTQLEKQTKVVTPEK